MTLTQDTLKAVNIAKENPFNIVIFQNAVTSFSVLYQYVVKVPGLTRIAETMLELGQQLRYNNGNPSVVEAFRQVLEQFIIFVEKASV